MNVKVIDVTDWSPIEESALGSFYSEGSLSKHLLEHNGNYYLFKETWTRSRKTGYFDEVKHQFWSEIIAAIIANIMNLNVPETYIGIHTTEKISFNVGVLNKWFLDKKDNFTKGSELLNRNIDGYDEKQHNLDSAIQYTSDIENSLDYWMKLMFFDALIGNTDRHHENWGTINDRILSPLYDNGISLGWRIKETDFSASEIEKQMNGFKFKMKVSPEQNDRSISGVIDYFLDRRRIKKVDILDFINQFDCELLRGLKDYLCTMHNIPEDYKLTDTRFDFICNYVAFRSSALKEIINNRNG